jgi:ribonucleotide reductase beta subunit family protein with ferritin-like domain
MSKIEGMTVFNTNQVDTKKQPMFFGAPLGVQRYDEYKYPIFEKLTQQQLSFFWRPEEITLQKDRADYQTLRPEQKHIFTSNLKYQIMLDSVQGRGPGLCLLPYTSLPELEACMTVWEFMEMIHSRSYTVLLHHMMIICNLPTIIHLLTFGNLIMKEWILEKMNFMKLKGNFIEQSLL